MQIYIDLVTRSLRRSLTNSQPVNQLEIKRGDDSPLEIVFVLDNVATALPSGSIIKFGCKLAGDYDGTVLVFEDDFTLSGGVYAGNPSFNTEALDTALGELKLLDTMGEVTWISGPSGPISTTKNFVMRVFNDVLKGDEGTPTELPDPAEWMPAALTIATGDPNIGEALVVAGTLTSNGSSSLVFPTLYDSGVASGKIYYTNVDGGLGVITHKIQWSTVSSKWQIFNGATVVFESANDVASPDLVTTWTAVSPATGTPSVGFDSTTGTHIGQFLQVLDTGLWYKWDGTAWELEAADLTSGPVTSTAGTSTIADGALTIAKTAGLQTALDGKVDDSQLSTTGGDNKVLQLNSSANLVTGDFTNPANSTIGGGVGNIFIPDKQGLQWLKADGTLSGQSIMGWDDHGGLPGTPELLITSPERIAIIAYEGVQLGPNDPARYPRYLQMVSGTAVSTAAMQSMQSAALFFQTKAWTGSASITDHIGFQASPLDASGQNSVLNIYDQAWLTESGNVDTAGRGAMTGNPIAQIYKEGVWSAGTAPAFVPLEDGGTITQTCSKYKTTQAASVTLAGNRTLSISGGLSGMRGVIYVTQDATGSRTLTPSGGTALGLSATAGYTDRVAWEFDGVYYNFSITLNVQREVIITDSDAAAFVTAASISSAPQKSAINTLVESLKAASLWSKFYALYPFVGGNATAHSKDLKAAYNVTWVGDPTHDTNGVTGDATDARGDTGINLNTLGAVNSVSGYVYSKTETPTDGGYFMGCTTGTTRFGMSRSGGNLGYTGPNSQETNARTAGSDFRKHFALNRSGASSYEAYTGDTRTTSTTAVVAAPNGQLRLFCRENSGATGNYSNANLGFAAVGQSLTESEWTAFRAIIDTFQTTLGRANP